MDVRAVDQATCADAGAVGADEVRVVGARAAGLLALAPDAALGQFEDHPSRLRLDALDHPLIVTIEEQPATVNRLLTDAELTTSPDRRQPLRFQTLEVPQTSCISGGRS